MHREFQGAECDGNAQVITIVNFTDMYEKKLWMIPKGLQLAECLRGLKILKLDRVNRIGDSPFSEWPSTLSEGPAFRISGEIGL